MLKRTTSVSLCFVDNGSDTISLFCTMLLVKRAFQHYKLKKIVFIFSKKILLSNTFSSVTERIYMTERGIQRNQ